MIRTLHAIIVVSNPVRYQSRWRLHREFMRRYEGYTEGNFRLHLTVVECAFGDRPFEVTDPNNPDHVQVRSKDELWHKENMINLGVQRLTENKENWRYLAWIDNDISFQNPNWLSETVQSLDHYEVVQMWEDAVDLGPSTELVQAHKSFMSQHIKGAPRRGDDGKLYNPHWHPGYAWACTRNAYDGLGGLLDIAILGAADHHMALALIGCVEESIPSQMSPAYAQDIKSWEERADHWIKQDVGFVRGLITHHWHGKKRDRKYGERWKILTENSYSPRTDLKKDSFGLWQLETVTQRQRALRDQIRAYLRGRAEDSVDLE